MTYSVVISALEPSDFSIHVYPFSSLLFFSVMVYRGFPDSSVGKESACNAGDPSSVPGSGRSPGEGLGYPLQYSWVSLMAWLVKNLPAMQETPVWFLGLGRSSGAEKGFYKHVLYVIIYNHICYTLNIWSFPGGSDGKESACN